MKKKLLFISTVIIVLLSFKKEDTTSTNASLIIGKWNYYRAITWTTPANSSFVKKDTTYNKPGEYIDFRTDGKVYSCEWYSNGFHYSTQPYTVSGNNLLTKDSTSINWTDTFEISQLTSSKLVIHTLDKYSTGQTEVWGEFNK
ncbi:MAG: hypothetical protein NTZ59_15220 [Bacteroidetes bacterium]|nr:hypothetical protein [Bacteroidota bacterium]